MANDLYHKTSILISSRLTGTRWLVFFFFVLFLLVCSEQAWLDSRSDGRERGKNPRETENSEGNSYDTCNNYSRRIQEPMLMHLSSPLLRPPERTSVPARHAMTCTSLADTDLHANLCYIIKKTSML